MEDRTQSQIFGQLWSLSLPIIGLNVLNVLSLAVDTAMCGRLPEATNALTALSYATQIVFLLMVAMMGLTIGTVALVARAYGGGDHERVNHILIQSTMLTAILGCIIAVVGNVFGGALLDLLGASPVVRDLGLMYLRPLLFVTPFYYTMILFAAVLRGVGNTRLPFMVALLTNLINAGINYCLILGNFGFPAMGLRGAALGTVISYVVGAVIMAWLLRRDTIPNIHLRLTPVPIDRPLTKMLVGIGTPAALDMVILNAAFLSIVGMLGRIDQAAVAAHGVGFRLQALAFVPGMSISQATGALVGQALGAGHPNEARRVLKASLVLCFLVMSSLGLLIVWFVGGLVEIFDIKRTSELGKLAITWIQLLGYGMPIVGIHIAFVGLLQGAGATKTSLKINLVTTAIQIPLSAFLGFGLGWGAYGVWLAFPLSFLIKMVLDIVVVQRGDWAKVGQTV